jgi:hypothetical protein
MIRKWLVLRDEKLALLLVKKAHGNGQAILTPVAKTQVLINQNLIFFSASRVFISQLQIKFYKSPPLSNIPSLSFCDGST